MPCPCLHLLVTLPSPMEGLVEDLKHAFLVAPFETSFLSLVVVVVVVVGVVVATVPSFFYTKKLAESSRDLQRRESCFPVPSSKCFKFKMHYARSSSSQLFLVE